MAEEEVPLTKERLFTMMAGYKATAVLRACVELGLFDPLANGPADAATLAPRLGVDERALGALLAAAAGVGLLVRGDDGYALPAGAADLLVTTEPGYCAGISSVVASQLEWTALGSLAGTVRRGGPVPGFDLLAPDFPYWTDFATHSTFVTTVLSGLVADALGDFATGRDSLDVGPALPGRARLRTGLAGVAGRRGAARQAARGRRPGHPAAGRRVDR